MFRLDRNKLAELLINRGWSINKLAAELKMSRQTIYNMFEGRSILSTPMERLLRTLALDFDDLVTRTAQIKDIIKNAPPAVKNAAETLIKFAKKEHADIFLIGSRTLKKKSVHHDWDFAIFFTKTYSNASFAMIKQTAEDDAFPHRIDIVNLNNAPAWFLESIRPNMVRIYGKTDIDKIFSGERMAA